MKQEGFIEYGDIRERNDGSFELPVFYIKDGEEEFFLATGEDHLDCQRDWAFRFLELFPQEEK